MSTKPFAVIGDKYYHPEPQPDPLGTRGHVFDRDPVTGDYYLDGFLRERAHEMGSALVDAGIIKPADQTTHELLEDGVSFSIHDRRFSIGVYARKLPGEVEGV